MYLFFFGKLVSCVTVCFSRSNVLEIMVARILEYWPFGNGLSGMLVSWIAIKLEARFSENNLFGWQLTYRELLFLDNCLLGEIISGSDVLQLVLSRWQANFSERWIFGKLTSHKPGFPKSDFRWILAFHRVRSSGGAGFFCFLESKCSDKSNSQETVSW